jgi:hypothetical protein
MDRRLPRLTNRLTLAPNVVVSPFCLGMLGEPRMIPEAFDAGINFFFVSADLHWSYYEPWRRGMDMLLARGGGIREKIVIAVTSYVSNPRLVVGALGDLFQTIRIEWLDVLVSGGVHMPAEIEPRVTLLGRTKQLCVDELRHTPGLGMTFHDRTTARAAVDHGGIDIAFIRYNPLHPGARTDVLDKLPSDRQTRIFNFKSSWGYRTDLKLSDDYWIPTIPDFYRYALTPANMDGLLLSLNSTQELQELTDALEQGPLSPDEEEHMEALAALPNHPGLVNRLNSLSKTR